MNNPDFVKPDSFIQITFGEEEFLVNKKYDRLEHYVPIGKYILKLLDDKQGLLGFFVSVEVVDELMSAGIQLIERHTMLQSEYEWHLNHEAANLEDLWNE